MYLSIGQHSAGSSCQSTTADHLSGLYPLCAPRVSCRQVFATDRHPAALGPCPDDPSDAGEEWTPFDLTMSRFLHGTGEERGWQGLQDKGGVDHSAGGGMRASVLMGTGDGGVQAAWGCPECMWYVQRGVQCACKLWRGRLEEERSGCTGCIACTQAHDCVGPCS
jgi:hypothetical protein